MEKYALAENLISGKIITKLIERCLKDLRYTIFIPWYAIMTKSFSVLYESQ